MRRRCRIDLNQVDDNRGCTKTFHAVPTQSLTLLLFFFLSVCIIIAITLDYYSIIKHICSPNNTTKTVQVNVKQIYGLKALKKIVLD